MIKVECVIHGENVDQGYKFGFSTPAPLSLHNVREFFPFEGDFFFRVKMVGSEAGAPDCSHVWLDLTEIHRPITTDRVVQIRAIPLKTPPCPEEQAFMVVQEEPEATEAASTEEGQEKEQNLKKKMGKMTQDFLKGAQAQSTAAAAALQNVNMKEMLSGASNLWKAVRDTAVKTASALPIPGLLDNEISAGAADNLGELSRLVGTEFSEKDEQHVALLASVWSVLFAQSAGGFQRQSGQWKQAGFQSQDPVKDLKNTGLLALQCFVGFGRRYEERCRSMVENNRVNSKNNYPFAVVVVNIVLLLTEVFHLRNKQYTSTVAGHWEIFADPFAFYEIFSCCFIHIDGLWTHRKAVRTDFGKIIGEVRLLIFQILSRGPKNLPEFKEIAADEGMLLL